MAANNQPQLSFKTYPPGSLTFRNLADCGWGEFDQLYSRTPVPDNVPILLIIGQQKAGTTWLYDVLKHHPAIVRARDDRPLEYALCHILSLRVMHVDMPAARPTGKNTFLPTVCQCSLT